MGFNTQLYEVKVTAFVFIMFNSQIAIELNNCSLLKERHF